MTRHSAAAPSSQHRAGAPRASHGAGLATRPVDGADHRPSQDSPVDNMLSAMSYDLHRYHITRDGDQTTVSIDNFLVELLSIKLGHEPGSNEARTAVRQWLQDRIDKSADPGRVHVS